jgi:hypothetical protein
MEAKLNVTIEENKMLKNEIKEKNTAIEELKSGYGALENKLNSLEQYNRSWSVRILNIPLTDDEEKCPTSVRNKVYELAFLPILHGALEAGEISNIPGAEELLEVAHVLPGKPGSNKPVIARFYNRFLRSVCLRLKKQYATKTPKRSRPSTEGAAGRRPEDEAGTSARSGDEGGWVAFPFFEDLTSINFSKMRAIANDSRVLSCWSVNGQLRFRLKDSTVVKKVNSVFLSVNEIINA